MDGTVEPLVLMFPTPTPRPTEFWHYGPTALGCKHSHTGLFPQLVPFSMWVTSPGPQANQAQT